MSGLEPFANLGQPRQIWAIAACHGAADRLDSMQMAIAERFMPGDRLVYLGNYIGGGAPTEAIDSLLGFRAALLAQPGMMPGDFVYLRGGQEEIWNKLLQIQFAPNPREVLRWMLDHGAAATLEAYGSSAKDGLSATREGAVGMTRWTNRLREAVRKHPGHEKFMTVLQRAAFTEPGPGGALLFVHAGLDPTRPLAAQGDSFWWSGPSFDQVTAPFETFGRIFRGYDPAGKGLQLEEYAATLDAGCGSDGPLIAAAIGPDGEIVELLEA